MDKGNQRRSIHWARIIFLAIFYFLTAQLSTAALGIEAAASPLWPPAGIALAALLLYGKQLWIGIALGALGVSLFDGQPWPIALAVCWGSALQALAASYVLRFRGLHLRQWQLPDLVKFMFWGVIVTPLINAIYSTTVGSLTGVLAADQRFHNAVLIWFGDGMGVLVFAPALLIGISELRQPDRAPKTIRYQLPWSMELCLCLGLLVSVSGVVFGAQTNSAIAQYPLEYLPFPFVVWAALRLGLRGSTFASFLVSVIAVTGAVHRGGPFITKAEGNLSEAILLLQAYIAVISVTALVLAVVVTERRKSEARLAQSEASLANAQRIAQLGNWDWDLDAASSNLSRNLSWSDELYTLLGYPVASVTPSRSLFLQRVHPQDRERVEQARAAVLTRHQPYALDYRLVLPDGTERIVSEQVQIEPHRITGTVQDITERKQAEAVRRESETLRATMYRYMSQELAEQLLQNGTTTLGGARQLVSILFADIRGYTAMTEQLEPEAVVDLLNAYFETMVDVIFNHKGTLDKFIGDAIMAVFGSPLPQADHAQRAVEAALEMEQQLVKFNQRQRQQHKPTIDIGIGINSDDVITGNMGSSKRMDFTAIGDGVNLTSRIEGATKLYGCSIIISEKTYQLCKEKIWVRELDYVCVKGKTRPVNIYEVLGLRSQPLTNEQQHWLKLYHQGRKYYQQQAFQSAINTFNQLLADTPDDQATRLHIKRCQQLNQQPPTETWDGAWQLNAK
ncbi:MAG: MASE1 domain-containing protein [Cyanobacteria bacterium P01_A01_bin.114]